MSPRMQNVMKPLVGISILLLVAIPALWLTTHLFANQRLGQLRKDAEAVLSAPSQLERAEYVKRVLRAGRPMLRHKGIHGGTVDLFQAAVAPLSDNPVAAPNLPAPEILALLDPQDLMTAARVMTYSQNLTPANTLVEFMLHAPRMDREAVLRLAITLRYDMGRDADVLVHCDELSQLAPSDFRPHQVKAAVYRNRNQWEHFVDAASRATDLAERTADLQAIDLIELIDGYLQLGQGTLAMRHMDTLRQRWPHELRTIPTTQARLLVQEGKLRQAEEFLDIALEQDAEDIEALVLKGTLLVSAERFSDAVELLQRTLKLSPTEERAHYQLGQAYARLGDEAQATQSLQKHRHLLDEKVRLYGLEETAGREPYNVQVRQELSLAYGRLGLTAQAEYWRSAARVAAQ